MIGVDGLGMGTLTFLLAMLSDIDPSSLKFSSTFFEDCLVCFLGGETFFFLGLSRSLKDR